MANTIFLSDVKKSDLNNGILKLKVDTERFCDIIAQLNICEHQRYNIGTYKEKFLHLTLKNYLEPNKGFHEIKYLGYVADIINENGIFEIQTGNFGNMKRKLDTFLSENHVTIVYPIVKNRNICWIDTNTGEISLKRMSPKHGSIYSILPELIYILKYINNPNLHFCAVLLNADEYRRLDGWSRDKKKGAHKYELIPSEILELIYIPSISECREFIPPDLLGRSFTIKQYALNAGMNYSNAQKSIKILNSANILCENGKKGREKLFCEKF